MKAALIGRGIGASLTPAMHIQEGHAQGLTYAYALYDMATPPFAGMSLAQALDRAEQAGCAGVNITFPYKQEVLGLLDDTAPQAREIGSVNTVVFEPKGRTGHNTDYIGYRTSFEAECRDQPHAAVLLVGAGGAGRAVGLALLDAGVEKLWITDANTAAAMALVDHLSALRPALTVMLWQEEQPVDGIVNATPMGMASHPGKAVALDRVRPCHWISDIVYFPLQTALLQEARALGLHTISGGGMAVGQAVAAFNLFTGLSANANRMAEHFAELST